jgi:hypothetical protein
MILSTAAAYAIAPDMRKMRWQFSSELIIFISLQK